VHYVAVLRVTAQYIGDDLAESLGIKAFVNVFDGVVYILLGCGYATQHVTFV
jgi:hypothetical protein